MGEMNKKYRAKQGKGKRPSAPVRRASAGVRSCALP